MFFFLGFKGLYPDMDPLCHVADSDCLSLGDSSLLTPIDRLYSMQDSYFTSWGWRSDLVRSGVSPSLCLALWSHHLSLCTMHWVVEEVVAKSLPRGSGYTVIPRNIPCAPPYKHKYTTASYALQSPCTTQAPVYARYCQTSLTMIEC